MIFRNLTSPRTSRIEFLISKSFTSQLCTLEEEGEKKTLNWNFMAEARKFNFFNLHFIMRWNVADARTRPIIQSNKFLMKVCFMRFHQNLFHSFRGRNRVLFVFAIAATKKGKLFPSSMIFFFHLKWACDVCWNWKYAFMAIKCWVERKINNSTYQKTKILVASGRVLLNKAHLLVEDENGWKS